MGLGTSIIRYFRPNRDCIGGQLSENHHFYLDYDGLQSIRDVHDWVDANCHGYHVWPEIVNILGPTTSSLVLHVTLTGDREAMLFRLRW